MPATGNDFPFGSRQGGARPAGKRREWARAIALVASLALASLPASAAELPGQTCRLGRAEREAIDQLRAAAIRSNQPEALAAYRAALTQRAQRLAACRQGGGLPVRATWLRLYPCDAEPGRLAQILDRIVADGYDRVHLEVFYDGLVLLPSAANPTPWRSIVREAGYERRDLLAEMIRLGRERGLKVYAWLFTMNFGAGYGARSDRATALARNGAGQTSEGNASGDETFIDPYSPTARADYQTLLAAVLQRRPDGVLFDYVRYPLGLGPASVAAKVKDLWIYGPGSRAALLARAANEKSRRLIEQWLETGQVADLGALDRQFPGQAFAWEGRNPNRAIGEDLWQLSLEHARRGVLDFVGAAAATVEAQNRPVGVVFFPGANRAVGTGGFDSRLQPWDRFSRRWEWHTMIYADCGRTDCVLNELKPALSQANGAAIYPALAGVWGRVLSNHPPLEIQMRDLAQLAPDLPGVSHYSYEWQYLEEGRSRKFCRLRQG